MKPTDLFDRDVEWNDLDKFVRSGASGLRVGVLYGRRRLGKSFLLRRLVRQHGGIYHMALEEESAPALQRFADKIAAGRGLGTGQLRFNDWVEALQLALAGPEPLLVLDELPYVLAQPAGATIPSALQSLYDDSRDSSAQPSRRVIICGSALAIMSDILSGSKALRGRAQLDLLMKPFDYRSTADFYRIADPLVAFRTYAVFGGVPGYRDLLADASPQTAAELNELILDTVCNPSNALFTEPEYLLREDPRITDRSLYYSILDVIAHGAATPSSVASQLGRSVSSMAHPLDVLTTAGFIRKNDDILLQRRPRLTVADPIVRFHDIVIKPRLAAFEDRRARPAWDDAQQSMRAQLYGPAFEELAREWTARYAAEDTVGGQIGEVGSTVVNDGAGRSQFEVDVVALAAGQRRQAKNPVVRAIGEAKDSNSSRVIRDLERLDRIRALLVARGIDATGAKLLLFSRVGFDAEVSARADQRHDVELVDLDRLRYGN